MKTTLTAAAALMLSTAAALAQTTPAQPGMAAGSSAPPAASATSARQTIVGDLSKAGFTDVKVVPDSFLVQAKDKAGHPVAMLIGPNSVTEVVAGPGATAATGTPAAAMPATSNGTFVTGAAADTLASKLIGTDVRNTANQDIGTVKDVVMMNGQVHAYVVSCGGFLGMGEHYVAVYPGALKITPASNGNPAKAMLNVTEAQLRAAPAFSQS